MLRKQGPLEDVYGKNALQDPRDMVKATLPESQFPVILKPDPPIITSTAGPSTDRVRISDSGQSWNYPKSSLSSGRWTMGNEPIQGNERDTYVALLRQNAQDGGIA